MLGVSADVNALPFSPVRTNTGSGATVKSAKKTPGISRTSSMSLSMLSGDISATSCAGYGSALSPRCKTTTSECTEGVMRRSRRRCKNPDCREWFHLGFQNQKWCCAECGTVIALAKREKDRQKAKQEAERRRREETQQEKRHAKIRKLALKPDSYFKKQAFNQFIRLRDHDQPCISCGETHSPDLHGGQWDCGHLKRSAVSLS